MQAAQQDHFVEVDERLLVADDLTDADREQAVCDHIGGGFR